MDKKVSVCNDKVLSQLQLPPQLIQTQFSQTDDQQYCTHIRIFSQHSLFEPLKQPTQSNTTPLKQSNTQLFSLLYHYLILSAVSQVFIFSTETCISLLSMLSLPHSTQGVRLGTYPIIFLFEISLGTMSVVAFRASIYHPILYHYHQFSLPRQLPFFQTLRVGFLPSFILYLFIC